MSTRERKVCPACGGFRMKAHMEDPLRPARTRCGLPIKKLHTLLFAYGSAASDCKMCQSLYQKDVAGVSV